MVEDVEAGLFVMLATRWAGEEPNMREESETGADAKAGPIVLHRIVPNITAAAF